MKTENTTPKGFYRAGNQITTDTSLYIVENLLKGMRVQIQAGHDLPMDRINQAIIQLETIKSEAKFYTSLEDFLSKNPDSI